MQTDTDHSTDGSPPASKSAETSKREKRAKRAENCARCGKPLGSSVYITTDGPSCYSCYSDEDAEYLGVVQDWELEPAAESDDPLPNVIITVSNGDTASITVTDSEQASEVGNELVGQECWADGDGWRFEEPDGGGSDGE